MARGFEPLAVPPVVLDLCSRAIVLDPGTVWFEGDPAHAIQEYHRVPWTNTDHGWTHQQSTPAVAEKPRPVSYMGTT
jgi:hypothetical protein